MSAKCKRKLFISFIILLPFLFMHSSTWAAMNDDTSAMYEVFFPDLKPFIDENNRTLVPLRFITEQLGANVSWDAAKNQVSINYEGDHINITAESDLAIRIADGHTSEYYMGSKAVLIQGRLMVPLRFLSEVMGSHVVWQESNRSVVVNECMVINLSVSPLSLAYLTQLQDPEIIIKDFYVSQDVYFANDTIISYADLMNNDCHEKTVWIQLNLLCSMNKSYITSPESLSLKPSQNIHIPVEWVIPDNFTTGNYQVILRVWDRSPEENDAVLLAEVENKGGLRLYKNQENFLEFNKDMWRKTSHMLECTILQPDNVILENGKLKINLPKGVLEGGEIQSCHPMGFGSYEIRMKIPDVPSSITGFFLYKHPAFHNEIDIEIYNQKNGEYFLTTYAEGEKKNLFLDKLPFDPTEGFHNYRIDYYLNQLRFYADDVLLKEWREGITNEKMYIVLNTWYPDWLDKTPAIHGNTNVEIDWIRY